MENSDLLMRALITRVEHLEHAMEFADDIRNDREEQLAAIALALWPEMDGLERDSLENADSIIAELQRRGVMNGGPK